MSMNLKVYGSAVLFSLIVGFSFKNKLAMIFARIGMIAKMIPLSMEVEKTNPMV